MNCEECNGDGGYYEALNGQSVYYDYRSGHHDFWGNKLEIDQMEWIDCCECGGSGEVEEEDYD